MKARFAFSAILVLLGNTLSAQNFLWARQFGNSSSGNGTEASAVKIGNSDNVYSTGPYTTVADFDPGPGTVVLPSDRGMFLSKLSPAGNNIWAKPFGPKTSSTTPTDMAIDANENLYITGNYNGSGDFDPGSGVTTLSGGLVFVMKTDSAGNLLWARSLNPLGVGGVNAGSVGVDGAGNVYVYGFFDDATDFDPGPGTFTLVPTPIAGLYDCFLLKLNSAGNFLWAKKFGTGDSDSGVDMVVDAQGNCYFSGVTWGGFGQAQNLNGQMDAFVAKANSSGTLLWSRGFGGGGTDVAYGIALDSTGQVWVTGYFEGTAYFNPTGGNVQLTSAGASDGYLSRYSNSGTFLAVYPITGPVSEHPANLAVATNGDLLLIANVSSTVDMDLGTGTLILPTGPMGGLATVMGRYTTTGSLISAAALNGAGICWGEDIDAKGGSVLLAGSFNEQIDMNPTSGTLNLSTHLVPQVGYNDDGFLVKLDDCIIPAAPSNTTPQQNLTVCGGNSTTLSATGQGTLTWYTSSSGGSPIGTGGSYITPALNASTTFWVQDSTCGLSGRTSIAVVVIQSSASSLMATACDSYTSPSGQVLTISGTYMDTIPSAAGCDSIITLQLTISHSSSDSLVVQECMPYTLNSQTYTATGTYTQVLTNSEGCDSVITLQLTITPLTATVINASPTLTAQPLTGNYQWMFCDSAIISGATGQSFTAPVSGSYAVIVTQNGCSDTSDCESIVLNAIFAPQMLSMSLHPNPSIGTATVDWGIPLTGQLWIMDAQGQIVFRRRVQQERKLELQVDLASGLYLIELRDEWGNHATTRMVRE